jgi:hypothetical protein
MKVVLVDKHSPRSDGAPGLPTGVTLGKIYEVAEVLHVTGQYSIINDNFKIARYSMSRFRIYEQGVVKPLREAFNCLTIPLRSRIKELEKQIQEMNK